jgi:hypothetical protein
MFAARAEAAAIMSAAAAKEIIPRVFMISNFNLMSRIADQLSSRQCILKSKAETLKSTNQKLKYLHADMLKSENQRGKFSTTDGHRWTRMDTDWF